jgi:hypothetical protein
VNVQLVVLDFEDFMCSITWLFFVMSIENGQGSF